MLDTREELALLGGPQAVGEGAVQPWPQVAAADKAAVMGVLERGVLRGAAAPEATAPIPLGRPRLPSPSTNA